MKRFHRTSGFNIQNCMTTHFGMTLLGYPYDEELSGPGGMHFHVWLPEDMPEEERQAKLQEIWAYVCSQNDATGLSWDTYVAEDEFSTARHQDPASINTIRSIVEDKELKTLRWEGGGELAVDLFTASLVIQVYDALNEGNQRKVRDMIGKGPGGLAKFIEFCYQKAAA